MLSVHGPCSNSIQIQNSAAQEVVEDAYRSTAARQLQAAVDELKRQRREARQAQTAAAAAPGDAATAGRAWPAEGAAGRQALARAAWPSAAPPHGMQPVHAEGRADSGALGVGLYPGTPPGTQVPNTASHPDSVGAGWPPQAPQADASAAAWQQAGGALAQLVPGGGASAGLSARCLPEAAWGSAGTCARVDAGVSSVALGAEAAEPMDMEE